MSMKSIFCGLLVSIALSQFASESGLCQSTLFPTVYESPSASFSATPATCSSAPCVLSPVQVSQSGATDASIAANPLSPQHLLVGADDFSCFRGPGAYVSVNAGSTWSSPACMMSLNMYSPLLGPSVGYDGKGVAYIAADYIDESNFQLGMVGFQRSSDGVAWGPPGSAGLVSPYIFPDSPWLGIDSNKSSPRVNSLYASSTQYICRPACYGASRLVISRSGDGGKTWQTSAVTPWQKQPAADEYSNIATGKDGTVFLTWLHCPRAGPTSGCNRSTAYMMFSKSKNGGSTWSTPTVMATATLVTSSGGYVGTIPNTKGAGYKHTRHRS